MAEMLARIRRRKKWSADRQMRVGLVGTESDHAADFARMLNGETRHPGFRATALWGFDGQRNAELAGPALEEHAALDPAARSLAHTCLRQGRLSARGLARIRRVARTLADLDGCDGPLSAEHIGQALALRSDPLGDDRAVA